MQLGAFSVSLAVKDLEVSRDFYGKLGFTPMAGDQAQGWLIMRSGSTVIGLFQGMFDKNILTFNPGWGQGASPLATYTDVREIQCTLESQGIELSVRTAPEGSGPAHIELSDPDGNVIMFDQHV